MDFEHVDKFRAESRSGGCAGPLNASYVVLYTLVYYT